MWQEHQIICTIWYNIKQEKPILYPNPTTEILNIENVTVNKILIYDLSGKLISKLSSQHQINVSNLSKGVYLFKLISEEEIIVNKIVTFKLETKILKNN